MNPLYLLPFFCTLDCVWRITRRPIDRVKRMIPLISSRCERIFCPKCSCRREKSPVFTIASESLRFLLPLFCRKLARLLNFPRVSTVYKHTLIYTMCAQLIQLLHLPLITALVSVNKNPWHTPLRTITFLIKISLFLLLLCDHFFWTLDLA